MDFYRLAKRHACCPLKNIQNTHIESRGRLTIKFEIIHYV